MADDTSGGAAAAVGEGSVGARVGVATGKVGVGGSVGLGVSVGGTGVFVGVAATVLVGNGAEVAVAGIAVLVGGIGISVAGSSVGARAAVAGGGTEAGAGCVAQPTINTPTARVSNRVRLITRFFIPSNPWIAGGWSNFAMVRLLMPSSRYFSYTIV